jgi:hypothetical protein
MTQSKDLLLPWMNLSPPTLLIPSITVILSEHRESKDLLFLR